MADWTAFATAFLRDTAGYINERKDKAEDYADKLREQAERNKAKIGKLRSAAKAQQGFISQARGLYATDEQIEAALDSGPTGLQGLVSQLSDLKTKYGDSYDQNLVNDYAKLPEGFKATGNIDPMSRYGLTESIVGDLGAPKGGAFSLNRMLGLDAKERARSELDAEVAGDTGMSIYDLAQISDIAGYESLNPSSFLSYTAPKLMTQGSVSDEILDLNTAVNRAEITADKLYNARMDVIAGTKYATLEDKKAAEQQAAADRDARIANITNNYVNPRRAMFDNYDELMGDTLEGLGITAAIITPTSDINPPARKPVPKPEQGGSIGVAPDISSDAPTMPSAPEADVPPGDAAKIVEAQKERDDMVFRGDEAPKMPPLQGGLMSPTVEESIRPKTITYEQWKKMSTKKRKALGLPTTKVGVQQIVRGGVITLEEDKPTIKTDSAKFEETMGVSVEKLEELGTKSEKAAKEFGLVDGQVDPMTVNLIGDNGKDIIEFFNNNSYTINNMGIYSGLTDWAQENKKQLPANMNLIIKFIKENVSR